MRAALLAFLIVLPVRPAAAAEWRVVPAESRIRFTVPFIMDGTILRGGFRDWAAEIRFDPEAPDQARIAVTVRAASGFTGDREADRELPSPEWMAWRAFPEARFVAEGVRRLAPGRYEAPGTLTLRDIARPVTLPFTLAIEGGRARMEAALALDRVAFGIGDGPDPAGVIVGREVALAVEVVAERRP